MSLRLPLSPSLCLALAALALPLASTHAAAPAPVPARPNIVLMMADDQGWGETGYNGHPHVKTPTLDAMAAGALRLDRFYAASSLCTPTRASVMTGRHANRSGAFNPNWSTRPEEITLAQILQKAGYRTGHFGKWHLGPVKAESPVNPGRMGFDEWLSHDNFFEIDPPLSRNGAAPEIIRGESSEIVAAEAAGFTARAHAEGKPFFVVLWFGSPHEPYRGTPEDVARYAHVEGEPLRHRFAEITAMDRAIGQYRAELRRLGVAADTLLWFNSDNGMTHEGIPAAMRQDQFNGGWRGHKGDIYEGGHLVPGLIEWPAVIKRPRTSAVPCVTSDIFPTVLDLLGLRSPDPARPLDGLSLRALIVDGTMTERPAPIGFWRYNPLLGPERNNGRWFLPDELSRGTTPTANNPAINFVNFKHPVARTENFGGDAAWRDGRHKLIVTEATDKKPGTLELYDLQSDPFEKTNLAPAEPARVAALRAALEAWQRSVERSLTGADYAVKK